MNNAFVQRPIVVIDVMDSNVDVIHPQFVVLKIPYKAANGIRTLDVGALCYTRRGRKSPRGLSCPVDLSSLDSARIPTVHAVIEHLRVKGYITAISLFDKIVIFMNWVDAQEWRYAFDDTASMKKAYIDYTAHLLKRMNSSGINGQAIKHETAGGHQAAARTIIRLASDMSDREIKRIATVITQNVSRANHVNLKLPDVDVQSQTFSALINYVEEAHRVLVEGGRFPLHLVSPSDESYYLYTLMVNKNKFHTFSMLSMLTKSPRFPSWPDVVRNFGLEYRSAVTKHERSGFDQARYRFEKNNENLRSALRRRIGNHAVVAGMLAFIAATSCNLSVARGLEIDTLDNVPSTQGKRLSGTKARARGKVIVPEFGVRFAPVFKKYMQLRHWQLNGCSSEVVFPLTSSDKGITTVTDVAISAFKLHMKSTLPNTRWVSTTQWRKNVSYQYVKLSGGDMLLTAEKLGNTEKTVRETYSRPALEDYATEMTSFFESMHQAAIDRTRSAEHISVRILDEKKSESVTTIGSCEKTPVVDPKRAQGFTEQSPAPACGEPETCLFCEFYGVHADERDIRCLLSLRYMIQEVKGNHPLDSWQRQFAPIIYRIDEILSAIQDANSSCESTIIKVRDEVENGALDPFWSIHFDTLITAGIVS
ncbi:hypothetical protein ACVXHM_33740 [Pseudomonas aeruginosa]|nr:hypothetical protein [Pseudomonas aeruginosa]UTN35983.1 hypothetical protein MMZ75_34195 [Pseudomonas aeruginosa]